MIATAEAGSNNGPLKTVLLILVVVAIVAVAGVWAFSHKAGPPPDNENSMAKPIDHGVPPPMEYGSPTRPAPKPAAQPQQQPSDAEAWGH